MLWKFLFCIFSSSNALYVFYIFYLTNIYFLCSLGVILFIFLYKINSWLTCTNVFVAIRFQRFIYFYFSNDSIYYFSFFLQIYAWSNKKYNSKIDVTIFYDSGDVVKTFYKKLIASAYKRDYSLFIILVQTNWDHLKMILAKFKFKLLYNRFFFRRAPSSNVSWRSQLLDFQITYPFGNFRFYNINFVLTNVATKILVWSFFIVIFDRLVINFSVIFSARQKEKNLMHHFHFAS